MTTSIELVNLDNGYQMSRFNAAKHGILSKHSVLPWEDADDYGHLLGNLLAEYSPKGLTELHLVETVATIMWRQKRVLQAEGSELRRGLHEAIGTDGMARTAVSRATAHLDVDFTPGSPADAIDTTEDDDGRELAEAESNLLILNRAMAVLDQGSPIAYAEALATFDDEWRDTWGEVLDGAWDDDEFKGDATVESLAQFLTGQIKEYSSNKIRVERRPLIRSQVIGQAIHPVRLTNLSRYETHLDRKLERTIAMLLKLQDMRRSIPAAVPT